jgi:hypothetical protein
MSDHPIVQQAMANFVPKLAQNSAFNNGRFKRAFKSAYDDAKVTRGKSNMAKANTTIAKQPRNGSSLRQVDAKVALEFKRLQQVDRDSDVAGCSPWGGTDTRPIHPGEILIYLRADTPPSVRPARDMVDPLSPAGQKSGLWAGLQRGFGNISMMLQPETEEKDFVPLRNETDDEDSE